MDEDDILYGNVSASIWSKLDLMNSHISVMYLSRFNFSKEKVKIHFPGVFSLLSNVCLFPN